MAVEGLVGKNKTKQNKTSRKNKQPQTEQKLPVERSVPRTSTLAGKTGVGSCAKRFLFQSIIARQWRQSPFSCCASQSQTDHRWSCCLHLQRTSWIYLVVGQLFLLPQQNCLLFEKNSHTKHWSFLRFLLLQVVWCFCNSDQSQIWWIYLYLGSQLTFATFYRVSGKL